MKKIANQENYIKLSNKLNEKIATQIKKKVSIKNQKWWKIQIIDFFFFIIRRSECRD